MPGMRPVVNEGKRWRDPVLGLFLTPDPLEYIDGPNMYIYCVQNPWGRFDPLGLDTYWGNRNLQLLGAKATSGFLSHTFIYTTKEDGTLKHTYSWGNKENDWYIDRNEDIDAAKDIIIHNNKVESAKYPNRPGRSLVKIGAKLGGEDMDDEVDKIVKERIASPNDDSHHKNGIYKENCKTEASKVAKIAKENLEKKSKSGMSGQISDETKNANDNSVENKGIRDQNAGVKNSSTPIRKGRTSNVKKTE